DGTLDVAFAFEVENQDRQLRNTAQVDGGHVHHAQIIANYLGVSQLLIANGVRVQLRVVAVNAVHLGRFQEDIRLQLTGTQGGGGVRGDERVAGSAREDDDPALLQVADCPAADVRLGDTLHADGGLQPRLAVETFEGVLQGQAVEDGRQHPHV